MSPQSDECSADGKVDDLNYPTWLSILLLLVGTVGFLSNILVCVTILKARFLHDVTHYLILNLAISDGLCCLSFGADMFMDLLQYPNNNTGEFAEVLHCRLIYGNYLFQSFAYTSAYNLVIISLERYIGIVTPLKYVRLCTKVNTCMAIIFAWVLGFCAYLVHLIGVQYSNACLVYRHNRCKLVHDWEWHFVPFIAGFVVPLVVMFWAYFQIIKALKQSSNTQNVSAQVRESLEAKKRVVHLMLIVTVTYIILYIPTQPLYMIIVTIKMNSFEVSPLGILLTDVFSKLPVLLNSVVNPFIYAFKYKKFRKGVRETMCQCYQNLNNTVGNLSFSEHIDMRPSEN